MTTAIIMLFIVATMAGLLLVGCRKGNEKSFFDIDNTGVLRGFFSIVIVLVHIPKDYQNPIQDMIGSFAYIGVTFFFMTSAYGLIHSYNRDPDSIKRFWGKRVVKLFVPMVLVNILFFALSFVLLKEWHFEILLNVNLWVRLLLVFYLIFWLVFRFLNAGTTAKTIVVCLLVCAYSLISTRNIEHFNLGWPTESLGFAYGLLLATYRDKFVAFSSKRWTVKFIVFVAASLVLGVLYLKFKSVVFVGDYVLKVLLGIAITLVILVINSKFSFSNPASRFLSSVSYEIYLVHNNVYFILGGLGIFTESGVYILVGLVVAILIAKLVNMVSKVISTPLLKN